MSKAYNKSWFKELEPLYIVETKEEEIIITGFTERSTAEKYGIRHLTVIIVPFVIDGDNAGKWIVHDRTAKQWGNGKINCKSPSWNFFGGHATADSTNIDLIGKVVPQSICLDAAKRELEEELLCPGGEKILEVWKNKKKTNKIVHGIPYQAQELIPIGFSSYTDKDNVELSYFYALPIPQEDVKNLFGADNYTRDRVIHEVYLPICLFLEKDLLVASQMKPDIEVCDAITRLWLPENKTVIEKLRTVIEGVCDKNK